MDQTTYYTINRAEISDKLLIDEMNKVNKELIRRRVVRLSSGNIFPQ